MDLARLSIHLEQSRAEAAQNQQAAWQLKARGAELEAQLEEARSACAWAKQGLGDAEAEAQRLRGSEARLEAALQEAERRSAELEAKLKVNASSTCFLREALQGRGVYALLAPVCSLF